MFAKFIYIYSLLLIKDFKKLVLKSITDLCYSSSVIKNLKNFESVKKLDYTQINASSVTAGNVT